MTVTSYSRTNAVAAVAVATTFRPTEREMSIDMAGPAGDLHYSGPRPHSQSLPGREARPKVPHNLFVFCMLLAEGQAPAMGLDHGQRDAIGDDGKRDRPERRAEHVSPRQGGQGVGEPAEIGPLRVGQRRGELFEQPRWDLDPQDRGGHDRR